MRLNRLGLVRYGRFQDAIIPLVRPNDGDPDVTLIYGPNEAGKTTAFEAFLEFLFGIRARNHPYSFRFKRSELLVGASLDIPGKGELELIRSGSKSGSLCDASGRPVDETILSSALHGLSREAFTERFSLDEAGLREGGARIAQAKGDLGQLLHAGVSGLTGIASVLDRLEEDGAAFHKKGGRSTTLQIAKKRLAEISNTVREAALTPEKDRLLRGARRATQAALKEAETARDLARQRMEAGRAAAFWFEKGVEIERVDRELASYPAGPDLPPGASIAISAAATDLERSRERQTEASAKIIRLEETLADNPKDPVAAGLQAELAWLDGEAFDGAPLKDRATAAKADLGRRIEERDQLWADLESIRERAFPKAKSIDAFVLSDQELADLDQALRRAQKTTQEALATVGEAKRSSEKLGAAPPKPVDLTKLRAAHHAWEEARDLSAIKAQLSQAERALQDVTATLPSNWQRFVEQGLPAAETLQGLQRAHADQRNELAAAKKSLEAAENDVREQSALLEAEETAQDGADASDLAETRRRRDTSWAAHRATLSEETALDFEKAMHADDAARLHFTATAEARERRASRRANLALAKARRESAQSAFDVLKTQFEALSRQIEAAEKALGLPKGGAVEALLPRLDALERAASARVHLSETMKEFDAAKAVSEAAFDQLRMAAVDAEIAHKDEDLTSSIGQALALEGSAKATWESWQTDAEQVAELEEAAAVAQGAQEDAARALLALSSQLPLQSPSNLELETCLPALREAQRLHGLWRALTERIAGMEGALAALEASVARMAALMGTKGETLDILAEAQKRTAKAREASVQREAAHSSLDEERGSLSKAQVREKEAREALERLFAGQGAEELLPPERLELLTTRDELRKAVTRAQEERQASKSAIDPALFDEELADLPDAARAGALEQALEEAQAARDAARDADQEAKRQIQEAYERAEPDALITEQATILEELRDGARRAATARLGALAARSALRSLAEERRSTMLKDVEHAFVAMTTPKWSGVTLWSQEQGERLAGILADGTAVSAEDMSTGTMGQLYFALRFAGYKAFAESAGPLPMVLDDIMETFDDARAASALKLCAEVGRIGQAIMFTHHSHLVELAREVIPGVGVVSMPE
ncbi:MAG: AAA family ATPase [Pseudomonadota bacterium]